MRIRTHPAAPRGSLEMLEEGLFLFRRCGVGDFACYFVGSLPFMLALLYYLHDMRYGAFAGEELGAAALGLTLLYLWMKCWQAVFARRLSARLGASQATIRLRDLWSQVAIQPTSLFVLPVSFALGLPFGWAYAYYQSLTVTGDPGAARRHAVLWPKQNHALLLMLTAFRIVVFFNILAAILATPELLKAMSGIETVFTRNPLAMLNTTLLCVSVALTYLAVGPIGIAVYVVRCFYGEALRTGQDLMVELKRMSFARNGGRAAAAGLMLLGIVSVAEAGTAARPGEEAAALRPTVESGDLEVSIERVLRSREFAWRLQRQRADAAEVEKGLIARAMSSILDTFNGWVREIVQLIARFLDWLADRRRDGPVERNDAISWRAMARGLLVVLGLAGIIALVYLLRRHWVKKTAAGEQALVVEPRDAMIVDDHEADRIASDRWMEQAKELIARGDLRAAMRAVYMAILSHLARGGLLTLAPTRTNRDYQRELLRRVRSLPDLPEVFSSGVMIFEKVWYGRHEPTREQLEQLGVLFEKVQSRVEA